MRLQHKEPASISAETSVILLMNSPSLSLPEAFLDSHFRSAHEEAAPCIFQIFQREYLEDLVIKTEFGMIIAQLDAFVLNFSSIISHFFSL